MLFVHAKALAASEVTRGGVVWSKFDPQIPKEDLAAEDWQPVEPAPEPRAVVEDCGCDGKVTAVPNAAPDPVDPKK